MNKYVNAMISLYKIMCQMKLFIFVYGTLIQEINIYNFSLGPGDFIIPHLGRNGWCC